MSADEDPAIEKQMMFFICGNNCDHLWDGLSVKIEGGESVTCSKCGVSNYEWCLFHAP